MKKVLSLLALFAVPFIAAASEADLVSPDGIKGESILYWGFLITFAGFMFGLYQFVQVKKIRAHHSMLDVAQVIFETEHKTRKVLKTNQDGLVSVSFPYDFPEQGEAATKHGQGHGHGRRQKADFVLSVEHATDERKFISHFNYHYTTGPFYNKNLALGIGFALFGMITAAPLLRNSKKGAKA